MAKEEIQLAWIRAFVAVHTTGSFTAAARQVHRVQSRVSAQVAQLERHLGAQLLVRGNHAVRLTDAGREFLPYAQAALQDVEIGAAAVTTHTRSIRGRVSVASYPGASASVLAPVITRFHHDYPAAHVDLFDGVGRGPGHGLLPDGVDLAVLESPPATAAGVRVHPLFREPFVCVVPDNHRSAHHRTVGPEVFTDETAIMTGDVVTRTSRFGALLAALGVRSRSEIVVEQPTTVTALVAAGMGIGILPCLAAQLSPQNGLRLLDIDEPGFVRQIVLMSRQNFRYPSVAQCFSRYLVEETQAHAILPPADQPRRLQAI